MPITKDEMMEMLADDQMKHAEAPADEEMDQMLAQVESESKAYRTAH